MAGDLRVCGFAMDLQQALNVALDYERKVRDHYATGAKLITDPHGRRVFEILAKEEQGHVDYLEHCLAQWGSSGVVPEMQLTPVVQPSSEWIEEAKRDLVQREQPRDANATELQLVKDALKLEIATSEFYEKLLKDIQAEHRPLFEKFLHLERGHVQIVQAELDSLQGTGFWFDVAEFSMEHH